MPDNQFDDEEVVVKKSSTPPPATNNADLDADFQDLDVTHTGDGLDRIGPQSQQGLQGPLRRSDARGQVQDGLGAFHPEARRREEVRLSLPHRSRSQACTGWRSRRLLQEAEQRREPEGPTCVRHTRRALYRRGQHYGQILEAREGQEPVAPKWELGWLKLSRAGFKAIRELVMEGESETDFDFAMGYQANKVAYSYSRVSKNAPRYKLFPEVEKAILEDARSMPME